MQASLGQDRGGEDVWNVATWKSDISTKVLFIRQNLKKQVIPASWKHTLNTQELYFVTVLKRSNRFDLSEEDIDNVDVIVEIIDEFIFNGGKELSAMQELHLLEILCSHFQANSDDIGRCLQFATMFNLSPHDEMKEYRCKMLAKLVSMSVALECSTILECVAVWIMKHRSSLQDILDLIQAIIYDYCILVPTSLPALESMVKHSSLLASQFLTAVTLLHPMYKPQSQDEEMSTDKMDEGGQSYLPPRSLLSLVANWITSQPAVSLTPYPQHLAMLPNCRTANQDMSTPVPTAPTGKLPLTPILGLIRWSILGPLCFLMQHHAGTAEQHRETMLVFSQLQFGVLQTFLTAKKQREEKDQESEIEPGEVMEEELDYRSLVTIHDLRGICMELLSIIKELPDEVSVQLKDELVEIAVDRLAQIIQVAKTTECLSGRKSEFSFIYPNLPRTRLLNLVLQSR